MKQPALLPPVFLALFAACNNMPPPSVSCPTGATLTRIAQIQGTGAQSPLVDRTVTTEGVVIGDYQASGGLGGFFIEDLLPGGDPSASRGLFVFAATPEVNSGDLVQVSGKVAEFAPSSDTSGNPDPDRQRHRDHRVRDGSFA